MSASVRLICCFLTLAGCLLPQGGESTGILGFVEDGSGSVVPGVEITATLAIKTWDVGLFKELPIREGQRFQFRLESFNLFNTPQFSAPNAAMGGPAFGQITSTWLSNRQMQLALKVLF